MANLKLSKFKSLLIEYLRYNYNKNPHYDIPYLIHNFLFDHITEIRSIKIAETEYQEFLSFQSDNDELKNFIYSSLQYFLEKYRSSLSDKTIEYNIPKSTEPSVENIFIGLEYSGNNDTDYKNLPSALSLATFKV